MSLPHSPQKRVFQRKLLYREGFEQWGHATPSLKTFPLACVLILDYCTQEGSEARLEGGGHDEGG